MFKNKANYLNFNTLITSINNAFKDCFDIFIPIKRNLDLYERNLKNCTNLRYSYFLELPNVKNIVTPKLDNLIMNILDDNDFDKNTRDNFDKIFNEDLCNDGINTGKALNFCNNFWSGILLKGIIQSLSYMSSMIGLVLNELESLNNIKIGRSLFSFMNDSYFFQYQIFNEYYLHRVYVRTKNVYETLRIEKLKAIIKKLLYILLIYLLISIFLFIVLYYYIQRYKYIFNSFIKFIEIFPTKYIYEDKNLYNEIIIFGNHFD